ncbi:HEPACAM family member 2 [Pristis pectinata]|uniref:HEPACAM family member 2 n=1 Tax=Pristis pectinata TaxID=685728 RepID=UPI00223E56E7|nr:HEPACAM family member 2 [Pristis pectinata]
MTHFDTKYKEKRQRLDGTCGAVTITVPTELILGTVGQPLLLPVNYTTGTKDQNIQITWTFQSQSLGSMLLVTAINNTLTPDMEHGHRFFLSPPSATLLINPVELCDDGEYTIKVTASGVKMVSASRQLTVHVNVPVSKPVVHSDPAWGAVEYVDNATLTCTVSKGTKVIYQWLKDGKPLPASTRHIFSADNKMLFISPVLKDDLSNYTCVAKNPISMNESEPIAPNIYYGPYDLMVKSEPRFKISEGVFAVGKGEPVWFKCSANSNPPNVYSWFQKANNKTTPIHHGPVLNIMSEKVPEKADYMCCVYNNITGKRDETQFTLILSATGYDYLGTTGLGPQLVTIYINELAEETNCHISRFVDYTKLGGTVNSEEDVANRLHTSTPSVRNPLFTGANHGGLQGRTDSEDILQLQLAESPQVVFEVMTEWSFLYIPVMEEPKDTEPSLLFTVATNWLLKDPRPPLDPRFSPVYEHQTYVQPVHMNEHWRYWQNGSAVGLQVPPDKLSTVYDIIRVPDIRTVYEVICQTPKTS